MKTCILSFAAFIILCLGCKNPNKEVFENYEKKSDKIAAAISYYYSIKPSAYDLDIEFPSNETFHLYISKADSTAEHSSIFNEYGTYTGRDIPLNDLNKPEYAEIIRISQLNKARLDSMRHYLSEANCFQIAKSYWSSDSVAHTMLGYERTWNLDATLYYLVYDEKLPKSILDGYEKDCGFKLINEKVLLQYVPNDGLSDWCFPDKQ